MLMPSKTRLIAGMVGIFVVGFLYLRVDALSAENKQLRAELTSVKATSDARKNIIAQYQTERTYLSDLLVERQYAHNKQAEKLKHDLDTLEAELANRECLSEPWPDAVIERLHEPY